MSEFVALGELVEIKGGGTPDKKVSAYWGGDIPWASVKDFKSSELSRTVDHITAEGVAASATQIIPAGNIIVPTRMAVGKAAINTIDLAINQDLKALIPQPGVDTRYLYNALLANSDRLLEQATGATVKGIKLDVLRGLSIPLPPLEEQKRIAGILDQAAKLCRLRSRALDTMNTLGQAIFHEMFGDLRNSRFPTRPFGEIADVRLGKMLDKGKFRGIRTRPYLRNVNVRWFGFDLSEVFEMEFAENELSRFKVEKGDLLICEGGEPGRCAVWEHDETEIYYQKALHRARVDPTKATANFIAFWFYIAAHTGQLSDFISSATIAHLTGAKIKTLPIITPPLEQQNTFEQRLADASVVSAHVKAALDQADTLFASLQHRAFRGDL
ncbi:restriction endonuclease subunit S [Pseudodonghicola xiamenensis]|uniref:Restriction modification system S chain-like protein n=1 Tax=Pseudodonghicola xiamenensis TaxID=337702 RepID=A0A8J3MBS8_9RHOB|nr:restriction endonuclease subunit S [Pseudodonghicola xiamenensis]GHG80573.1 restriction modification system S chain-like protein [Pseudodonghicola xiamenensis]